MTRSGWFILVLNLTFILSAYPQGNNRVSGRVVDATTGESLPGAALQIEGSSIGTVTDLEGNFELSRIRDEKINLVVSYISYTMTIVPCDFSGQRNLNVIVRLEPTTEKLEEVSVVGQAEGQVKALLDQKVAVNIKNIVSSEQITEFPDMNAAEVLQRIPGITLQRDQGDGRYVQLRGTPPELTNFNINGEQIPSPEGNVRYVGLDVISADQIETIEVTKVLTPDMDADGIGGNVNIITKTAKEGMPDIRASVAGGYNNLRGTGKYQLQFSYGQRYKKVGFHMNASHFQNNQGADNMEFKYEKGTFFGSQSDSIENYHVQFREYQLRHYNITRKRTGVSATLDYHFNNNSTIYIRGMYNSYSDNETRRRLIYELDDAFSETYYLYGSIEREVKDRIKLQNISSVNLGGDHKIGRVLFDYEAAYAVASEDMPNRLECAFDNPGQAIAMEFDLSDPNWPRLTYPNPADSANAYNYEGYPLSELLLLQSNIEDRNITGKFNVEIPYGSGRNTGSFKFGGKVRLKEKVRDIDAQVYGAYRPTSNTYPGEGPELNLTVVEDGFSETDLLNRGYTVDHIPGRDEIYEFYDYWRQFFILDRTKTKFRSYGEDYTAKEDVYAAYGMLRHEIGKLMLLGGVRYERTNIDYQGTRVVTNPSGKFDRVDTLSDQRVHEFILPQFQVKYRVNDNMNFRAAATYTYSRPNFEDVLPYRAEERLEVKYGNPDLEFPKSLNIDLLGEKYLAEGGIISGGLFYKNIKDFIFYYKRFGHEGDPSIGNFKKVQIEKAMNGNKAFVYGAELVSQFKFYFIPGFFSQFGIYLNYTFTYSEAYIDKRYPANEITDVIIFGEDETGLFSGQEEEKIPLPGQSMHSANLALFFDSDRFYAKITANYHDAFLYRLGVDADLDEYYDKAWHLDFTTKYSITDQLSVFADFINLTNAPLKFYMGTPDRLLKQEYYSWQCRLGIKYTFF